MLLFSQIILYGSYFLLFILLLHRRRALRAGRVIRFLLLTVLLFTFIQVRWIEPRQLAVEYTQLDVGVGKRIALLADFHLGLDKDRRYLQRVVNTVNSLTGIDMLLIAGDFSYYPTSGSLQELYQPLEDITLPMYAVLGNHDVEKPGPKLRGELVEALEHYGVRFLNNDVVDMGGWYLVGLGDHDGGEDDVFLLNQFHVADDVVVLTHNPDTILSYANYTADVTLVGHTHCGQIRLPFIHDWIKKRYIPVKGDFDCGWSQNKYTHVFITP